MELVYYKQQTGLVITVVVVTVILVFTMNGKTKPIDTGNTPEDDDDNNDDDATETNTSEGENDDTNANRTDEKKSNRNYYWLLLLFLIPIGVFILIISYRKRKISLQHKTTFKQNLKKSPQNSRKQYNNDDNQWSEFDKTILNYKILFALDKNFDDVLKKKQEYTKKYDIKDLDNIPIPQNEYDKIIHQLAIDFIKRPV